jgi:hypothetical protein
MAVHKTDAGERRKALKMEALELAKDAVTLRKAAKHLPDARMEARNLQAKADTAQAEAEALKTAARLEDLHLWKDEKTKGERTYSYWRATWREGGKVHNVHLGSCRKVSQAEALAMARKLKAESLGI